MIDVRPLLNPTYWLTADPMNVDGPLGYAVFIAFALLLLLGVILRAALRRDVSMEKPRRKFRSSVASYVTSVGVIGIVLWFLSFEGIRVLGARFWYLLLIILVLGWGGALLWYKKTKLPQLIEAARTRSKQAFDPYLPRPKKR